jgi:uncharacterized membrane protein YhdT
LGLGKLKRINGWIEMKKMMTKNSFAPCCDFFPTKRSREFFRWSFLCYLVIGWFVGCFWCVWAYWKAEIVGNLNVLKFFDMDCIFLSVRFFLIRSAKKNLGNLCDLKNFCLFCYNFFAYLNYT